MNRQTALLSVILVCFLASGCGRPKMATAPPAPLPQPEYEAPARAQVAGMMSAMSREVARKVSRMLMTKEEDRYLSSRLAVVAAVPLADLKRDTEFGRLLAELLLTDLADQGLQVQELRLGRDISIIPMTGEFVLSRNYGELAEPAPQVDYVVATTFSNTRTKLLVQGRLIHTATSLIEASWRYALPLDRDILGLFHDQSPPPTTIAAKRIP